MLCEEVNVQASYNIKILLGNTDVKSQVCNDLTAFSAHLTWYVFPQTGSTILYMKSSNAL